MENKQISKKSVKIEKTHPDYYLWVEPQPSLKRIEVIISYGLLDGLYDSIIFFNNGRMRYTPSLCTYNIDIPGIKKLWE